jgi:hypothetical protein
LKWRAVPDADNAGSGNVLGKEPPPAKARARAAVVSTRARWSAGEKPGSERWNERAVMMVSLNLTGYK